MRAALVFIAINAIDAMQLIFAQAASSNQHGIPYSKSDVIQ
jgi:hypothetical protein